MRNELIRLAIENRGSYFRIRKALAEKRRPDDRIRIQRAVTILDEEYPRELLSLRYPPFVLFYAGNIKLLKERKMAVVGSRNTTDYGIRMTRQVVSKLKNDFVIVSGMAIGIDAAAHENALRTIGVLGNGLDVCYPLTNSDLYEYMKNSQLLISEYPLTESPARQHFPFRNRIIAGLAEGVVVTQAREKSGTMLTVNEALAINKDVYAIPYDLDDESGSGCNLLICQGANIILRDFQKGGLLDFI